MRKILAFLLIFVMMIGVAGCDGNPSAYVPTGDGLDSGIPTNPTGSNTSGRNMSLPYYKDRSVNPLQCTDYVNRTLMNLLYQGLFAVDSQYEVHPILCKNYQMSRDMKTYTFYLQKATFSDGSVLTAEDVVESLKQAKNGGFYDGRFDNVKSIAAVDDSTVKVTLAVPHENFPVLLDVPIVKASQVGDSRPLGTGPFLYEEYGQRLWLRRRQDWWCRAATPVMAEYIDLVEAQNPAQLVDAFERADSSLGVVVTDPGSVIYADFHKDAELWDCETGIMLFLACNAKSTVFKNDIVRQALTYAINRSGIAEQYYRGFAVPTALPVSPKSPMYASGLASKITYDPARLTLAVTDADLVDSPVKLLVNSSDGVRLRVARAIASALSECGLKVTTVEKADADFRKALSSGNYDLYLGQTKLSANMDLSAFFASKGALSFGSMNDPVLYALCQDALANEGNYYTLYQKILEDAQLCPVLMRSYAVYAQRGALSALEPARDCVFYYDFGTLASQVLLPE